MDELLQSKKKRKRDNPTHRWTDLETSELVQAVSDLVKENPESFEKPTCQKFYDKFGNRSVVLQSIPWFTKKNKMRHLKSTYMSAAAWKAKTGAGLLETGDEASVSSYIAKVCPHWDLLGDIFGQRKSVNPTVIYETTNDVEDLYEITIDSDFNYEEFNHTLSSEWEPINTTVDSTCIDEPSTTRQMSPSELSASRSGIEFTNFIASKPKKKGACVNSMDNLISIQEKKLKLEEKKFELEKKECNNFELN